LDYLFDEERISFGALDDQAPYQSEAGIAADIGID
jgi:hypothetical protein